MVHLSKKLLKKEVSVAMGDQLIEYIAGIRKKDTARKFITELFSKEERIMIAKRLSLIVMLDMGFTYDQVERTLQVSPRTVRKIVRRKAKGEFETILNQIESCARSQKRKGEGDIFDILEIILQAGMPPITKGRWKGLFTDTRLS